MNNSNFRWFKFVLINFSQLNKTNYYNRIFLIEVHYLICLKPSVRNSHGPFIFVLNQATECKNLSKLTDFHIIFGQSVIFNLHELRKKNWVGRNICCWRYGMIAKVVAVCPQTFVQETNFRWICWISSQTRL